MRRSLVALALLLAACGGTPAAQKSSVPPPTTAASVDSTAPAPVVIPKAPDGAACYQYDAVAALAPTNDSTPVDCRQKHDAKTFYVGRLTAVAKGHLLGVESKRVHAQIAAACPAKLRAFLGGGQTALRLSTFSTVWFTPTVADSDQGANWFRCDVVSVTGRQLNPLTRSLKGILDRPADARAYGRCQVDQPGPQADLVPCTEKHGWRAVEIVDLGSGAYPSSAPTAGQDQCKTVGRSRAADPLNFRWAYAWPTPQQWAAGQTWGYCWVPEAS